MKFELGRMVAAPGAVEALSLCDDSNIVNKLLKRHSSGDWGDLDAHDKQQNDEAIENETRILSAYTLPTGDKIWVITEADRSVTTFLLPDEY